ncbi:MAG: hypothetical protein N2203_03830 [Bacteroidia bacterium]|nr:hypothetical protein [Bacteroidia bacterium]
MKRNHILYPVLFFVLIFSYRLVYSQISASAEINKSEIRIGDPIQLKLSLNFPSNSFPPIHWPAFNDTITSKIEIIDASKIDTIKNTNSTILQQILHISAYDSGQFVLPSIKFYFKNDSTQFVQTNSVLITVHTVPTDTSETSIKDIKPIFEEPFDIKWYFPLIIKILIALIVFGIIIYLIYYFTRKKSKQKETEKPKLPPHILALQKLEQLKQEQIWKEGKIKEYYSGVADTIREYIEGRYNIQALEQTTFETLQALKFKAIDPSTREKLKQLLELADLVKFAKFIPIENDHIQILENAFEFVHQTKQEITHTAPSETSNNSVNTN